MMENIFFKYLADNVADIYLDNQLLGRTKRFKCREKFDENKEVCISRSS